MSDFKVRVECKNCGLLKSTVEATGHSCLENMEHDFGISVSDGKKIPYVGKLKREWYMRGYYEGKQDVAKQLLDFLPQCVSSYSEVNVALDKIKQFIKTL